MILDTALTPDLKAEGYARDAIRAVQDARKEAGLAVSDHIDLTLAVPSADKAKVEQFADLIKGDTLADTLTVVEGDELAVTVKKD